MTTKMLLSDRNALTLLFHERKKILTLLKGLYSEYQAMVNEADQVEELCIEIENLLEKYKEDLDEG